MFELQGKPNLLADLLGQSAGHFMEHQQKTKTQKSLLDTLSKIKEDSTPMERWKIVESSDLPSEEKKRLHEGGFKIEEMRNKKLKGEGNPEEEERNYGYVKEYLGEKTANLWRASDPGAKTEIIKKAIESEQRGNKFLENVNESGSNEAKNQVDAEGNRIIKTGPPKGLTPKERVEWSEKRRAENLPIYKEGKNKIRAWERDKVELGVLKKLSKELPQGLSKIIFNPMTGEPYKISDLLGTTPPAVRRWVKTINEFTKNAKDSYGSRVTNFDLEQFLKRFPSAMDSPEAREQILTQMTLVSELDQLYESALNKIYAREGIGNITPEDADELAEKAISKRRDEIYDEVMAIGNDLKSKLTESGPKENQFDSLPDPGDPKLQGRRIQTPDGKILKNINGQWVPQEG